MHKQAAPIAVPPTSSSHGFVSCRCKQAEILAGVCGQREALERRVYEQDVQLELSLDELETTVQVMP